MAFRPLTSRVSVWATLTNSSHDPIVFLERCNSAQKDLMAMGVIDYCRKIGIEVGRELALIGVDDREICTDSRPTLSSVSLPLFEIG